MNPLLTPDLSAEMVIDTIHFYCLMDSSSTMAGAPMHILNEAMTNLIFSIDATASQQHIRAIMHILTYAEQAVWTHSTSATRGIDSSCICWTEQSAYGRANLVSAIHAIMPGLSPRYLGRQGQQPVLILLTTSKSSPTPNFSHALTNLIRSVSSLRFVVSMDDMVSEEMRSFASMAIQTDSRGNSVSLPLIYPADGCTTIADLAITRGMAFYHDSLFDLPFNTHFSLPPDIPSPLQPWCR